MGWWVDFESIIILWVGCYISTSILSYFLKKMGDTDNQSQLYI